ncbi:ethanolamine ammonia-lyase subunit EutC [Gorillibacterium sp. sgz500922]|uniref:ethanolamine ammonia-lyase subunit EutC n=1 Tax=Gorillibacterium sp. sgz500922 TaxID=3446694 RepID=UPI003F667D23
MTESRLEPEKRVESQLLQEMKRATPARIGVSRTGTRPLTQTMLELRLDHAQAVDSVYGEVSPGTLAEMGFFSVDTCFGNKEQYLKRPDLGRRLHPEAEKRLLERCKREPQVQIVVSDGLSAASIEANIRDVYPALLDSLRLQGFEWGTTFFVRGGRVGCMDPIGDLLKPECLVLLIGERPGLVTAESMSAYLCYRPRTGRTDSDRLVLSNIHRGGTSPMEAGAHIGTRVRLMLEQKASGVGLDR